MKKYKIAITQIREEKRIVEVESESRESAEDLVAEGINNLGFSYIGESIGIDIEERVNDILIDYDGSLYREE